MKWLQTKKNTRWSPLERQERRRVFFCTFGLASAALLLMVGLITVDYRGRSMSFGETALPVSVAVAESGKTALHLRFFEVDASMDITPVKKFLDFFCDFCCIPHK